MKQFVVVTRATNGTFAHSVGYLLDDTKIINLPFEDGCMCRLCVQRMSWRERMAVKVVNKLFNYLFKQAY